MTHQFSLSLVYFQENKKSRKSKEKEKCHTKSMMSNEANERIEGDTQHVPLSQKIVLRGCFVQLRDSFFLVYYESLK